MVPKEEMLFLKEEITPQQKALIGGFGCSAPPFLKYARKLYARKLYARPPACMLYNNAPPLCYAMQKKAPP